MRYLLIILIFVYGCDQSQIDDHSEPIINTSNYKGFTLDEARGIFREDPDWNKGGDSTRYRFLNWCEFNSCAVIDREGPIWDLSKIHMDELNEFITTTRLGELKLKDYISQSTVDAFIVLHKGKIVYEVYPRMFPYEKHILMSISKTFPSTLIGKLVDQGKINTSYGIESYFPEFINTDWEGVKVIDVLDMASGHCFSKVGKYDPCIRPFYNTFSSRQSGYDNMVDFYATMKSFRAPGEAYEYSNVNTVLLSLLVERVTGISFAEYISQELWRPMGAESDALLAVSDNGNYASWMGVSSTLRDLARYGALFTPTGQQKNGIISAEFLQRIQEDGRPEILQNVDKTYLSVYDEQKPEEHTYDGEAVKHQTRQWDIVMEDGDFFKAGYGGQGLYISPGRDLVMAFFGTLDEQQVTNQMHLVCRQLAKAGLFDI